MTNSAVRLNGVSVATTSGAGGRFGATVSAFASLSADPPQVPVCIDRASPARSRAPEPPTRRDRRRLPRHPERGEPPA